MATQITNQASLKYNSGDVQLTTASNTVTITMNGPLEVNKYSLESFYKIGEVVTYNVFIQNTSAASIPDVEVSDDLGTYAIETTSINVSPLTYIGPARTFLDGGTPAVVSATVSETGDLVTFNVGAIPAGSTLLLQYQTRVNQYAPAELDTSQIENIVSVSSAGLAPITSDYAIPIGSYAKVIIEKSMSPDPVVDGNILTYTFTMKNIGTINATDVFLTDTLSPLPVITSVTVDGVVTTNYSMTGNVFQYPSVASGISHMIEAAKYTQDHDTGIVAVVPGKSTIVIQGNI